MEIRNVKLALDKAKEWYKQGGELKEIALQAFKEEELKDSKPRSWEEYIRKCKLNDKWRKKVALTDSQIALLKLFHLRQAWIGNWKPDWSKGNYCIAAIDSGILTEVLVYFIRPLSFPTKEMANEFLNCFKDLLEQARGLY